MSNLTLPDFSELQQSNVKDISMLGEYMVASANFHAR